MQSPRVVVLLAFSLPVFALQPVRTKRAMVVAQEELATDAGVAVLKSGGNAVDASVAVAFALAATYPTAGNLGGGGFLLVRMADGRTAFLDFRERAPGKATRGMYLDAKGQIVTSAHVDRSGQPVPESIAGWRAAGVPGTVRGLDYAHKKFGTRPWAELVKPAVDLAARGFTVPYSFASNLRSYRKMLEQFPETKRVYLKDGAGYEAGEKFVQPDLARTLERIMRRGAADFYEGETAHKLADAMASNGGLITLDDLKNYKVMDRTPLTGRYRGLDIITAPPSSSGGVGILQMMGVLEGSGYEKAGAGSAEAFHWIAEAMKRYYADRSEYLADADFVKVPIRGLLDPGYIARLRNSIDPRNATPSDRIHPGGPPAIPEPSQTTHFSIVDEQGNAAALTYTINGTYGSGVTVPGLGFLLNNEMDDFAAQPGAANMFGLVQGEANAIQPGKRPLSSMTPTIVLRDGKLWVVAGAPGGSHIITAVLQVLLNVIDFKMNIRDAVDAPRIHHQWQPDRLEVERRISPDTVALLRARGHNVQPSEDGARVEAIRLEGGWMEGAYDARGYGKVGGY